MVGETRRVKASRGGKMGELCGRVGRGTKRVR